MLTPVMDLVSEQHYRELSNEDQALIDRVAIIKPEFEAFCLSHESAIYKSIAEGLGLSFPQTLVQRLRALFPQTSREVETAAKEVEFDLTLGTLRFSRGTSEALVDLVLTEPRLPLVGHHYVILVFCQTVIDRRLISVQLAANLPERVFIAGNDYKIFVT